MAEEEKKPTYKEFAGAFHTFNDFTQKCNDAFKNGNSDFLRAEAIKSIPENLPEDEKYRAVEFIRQSNPYIPEEGQVIKDFLNVNGNRKYRKYNTMLENNLEDIIYDSALDERILMSGISYLNPNPTVENENYKKISATGENFKLMNYIYQKAKKKPDEITEKEHELVFDLCSNNYKELYSNKEDEDIVVALTNLSKISMSFRYSTFSRLKGETEEKLHKEVGEYGARKYVYESLKDNYASDKDGKGGNMAYFSALDEINSKNNSVNPEKVDVYTN